MRPTLRTIVEERIVSASIKRTKQEYPRIEEMFDGFKWVLARNPFRGATAVREGQVIVGYVLKSKAWKGGRVPSIKITYKVTEHEVIVEGIAISEE